MRRLFTFAITAALAASLGGYTWSQASQSGGGGGGAAGGGAGATGSAGAAGTTGASGASGTATTGTAGTANTGSAGTTGTGTAGASGSAGTAGTSGSAGNAGTAGRAGVTGNVGVGQNRANVSGQLGANANGNDMNDMNGISPTPWFAEPGARRQLGINDAQFNRLNRAYQNSLQRFSQNNPGLNNTNANQASPSPTGPSQDLAGNNQGFNNQATNPVTPQQAQQLQNQNAQARTNATGTAGTGGVRQQGLANPQDLQSRFDADFNASVNTTLTDQRLRNRFNQMGLQFRGLNAFSDPTIQRQMNLTAQQQRQLRQLAGTFRRDLTQLRRDARSNPTLTQQQFAALQAQYMNQMTGILNQQQQQMWAQLTGQQYQFPYNAYFPENTTAQPTNPQNARPAAAVPQTGAAPTQQNPTVR